ncbi:unnamed protein product, partial [Brenthis ino]
MPSSDSEDFESADEGRNSPNKKERKKRLSSSNYSDNLESEQETKKVSSTLPAPKKQNDIVDGWDDFDIEEESIPTSSNESTKKVNDNSTNEKKQETASKLNEPQSTGWDDFDDWGDENTTITSAAKDPPISQQTKETSQTTSTKTEGWGWGWGMDSLLSSATAGISTLTTQVSQDLSKSALISVLGHLQPVFDRLFRRFSTIELPQKKGT